jgi:hypothetical protein
MDAAGHTAPGMRQQDSDPHGLQEGRLSGHVRTGYEAHPRLVLQVEVIRSGAATRKWMTESHDA